MCGTGTGATPTCISSPGFMARKSASSAWAASASRSPSVWPRFDCPIAYFDINQRDDLPYTFVPNLIALAEQSEFLIVTLAGGASTQGIINADVLQALGRDGILINISRGSTVDEAALLDALERNVIKGAGLDVFWNEPNIDERFLTLENVILQPHHASGTVETRQAMGKLVRDNLAAHFARQPLLTPVI